MRKLILLLVFSFGIYMITSAQTSSGCVFERLFVIKPGLDKAEVIDSLNKIMNAKLVSSTSEKIPPYANTSGDSIIKENYTYRVESNTCFDGNETQFQLVFADNKLFKVYISTAYPKAGFQNMLSNFNALRNVIKPKWKYETSTKVSGGNVLGFGYRYTKTQKATDKTENILLQYVDENTDKKTSGNYTLEVVWANLSNTRMQTSNY